MRRFAARLLSLLCIVAAVTAAGASPAMAGDPPGGTVGYRALSRLCSTDGVTTSIGANVLMREVGRQGVTQMKVTFKLLVDGAYTGAGSIHRDSYSSVFPNDTRSFEYKTGVVQWTGLSAVHSYSITSKLTWKRPHSRDWNYDFATVRCD